MVDVSFFVYSLSFLGEASKDKTLMIAGSAADTASITSFFLLVSPSLSLLCSMGTNRMLIQCPHLYVLLIRLWDLLLVLVLLLL